MLFLLVEFLIENPAELENTTDTGDEWLFCGRQYICMSGAGHGVSLSILIVGCSSMLALGAADSAAENTLSKILGGWPLTDSETPVILLRGRTGGGACLVGPCQILSWPTGVVTLVPRRGPYFPGRCFLTLLVYGASTLYFSSFSRLSRQTFVTE